MADVQNILSISFLILLAINGLSDLMCNRRLPYSTMYLSLCLSIAIAIVSKQYHNFWCVVPVVILQLLFWDPKKPIDERNIGGGDLTVFLAIGLYCGLIPLILVIAASCFTAILWGIIKEPEIVRKSLFKVIKDLVRPFVLLWNKTSKKIGQRTVTEKSTLLQSKLLTDVDASEDSHSIHSMDQPLCFYAALYTIIFSFLVFNRTGVI